MVSNDPERVQRIRDALKSDGLDAVLCALPAYVLMLSGYCPVVGESLCVATGDGKRILLVPEDEEELARRGHADEIKTYQPATLDNIQSPIEAAAEGLKKIFASNGLTCARTGYELGPVSQPTTYSALNLFGGSIVPLLRTATPASALAPADEMLARLAAVKTPREVERIRISCEIASRGFQRGRAGLRLGISEASAAELFRCHFAADGVARPNVARADGFAWCMSGRNSAQASAAYARSRDSHLARHDFVLIHANSHADGYWTDITRTYVLGAAEERQLKLYEAIFSARAAALAAIRPGVRGCDVDRAAREVLRSRGLAEAFRHSTGHGVGFSAISANARPRIHPQSEEVLEEGMVFNVEPAV